MELQSLLPRVSNRRFSPSLLEDLASRTKWSFPVPLPTLAECLALCEYTDAPSPATALQRLAALRRRSQLILPRLCSTAPRLEGTLVDRLASLRSSLLVNRAERRRRSRRRSQLLVLRGSRLLSPLTSPLCSPAAYPRSSPAVSLRACRACSPRANPRAFQARIPLKCRAVSRRRNRRVSLRPSPRVSPQLSQPRVLPGNHLEPLRGSPRDNLRGNLLVNPRECPRGSHQGNRRADPPASPVCSPLASRLCDRRGDLLASPLASQQCSPLENPLVSPLVSPVVSPLRHNPPKLDRPSRRGGCSPRGGEETYAGLPLHESPLWLPLLGQAFLQNRPCRRGSQRDSRRVSLLEIPRASHPGSR